MPDLNQESLELHKKLVGKLETSSKAKLADSHDLSLLYTPGVGAVSTAIAKDKSKVYDYTIKANTVAVISDGSALLGLGNVGAEAALPVMEGKALLFHELAGLNATPLVLSTQDSAEIIAAIHAISPTFGAINLEDIAAPKCFEIEQALHDELDIPVVHDDQHATAIVVLAGLLNALKVRGDSEKSEIRIVIIGAGAAGNGTAKLLLADGFSDIVLVDSNGIIGPGRYDLDIHKRELAELTNPRELKGDLGVALSEADVIIGLSHARIVKPTHIQSMRPRPIVFAMANPVPEIMPDEAEKAGAFIVATGRSDFPNQINNVLVFPGMFAGLMKHHTRMITQDMKLKAAHSLAAVVKQPTRTEIIPTVFDKAVVPAVSEAMRS